MILSFYSQLLTPTQAQALTIDAYVQKRLLAQAFAVRGRVPIIIEQDEVFVDVTLSSIDIHLSDPTFLTIHYWRYFVKVTGEMSYNDKTEHIDEKIQIIEYMRFI